MEALRAGELCAGYGGLALAVEEVFGAHTAWVSEFDEAPSKILAHHWPDVPNYGDMTKIDWAAIEAVDIISGGTPCQDLSAAGRRAGMTEGTRSNLWVQMREAIAVQRPRYVVWENVRGAYSATAASDLEQCPGCLGDTGDGGPVLRALGRVLGDLSDLGYDCQWRGLRAADVGACHGRFRVFVLAQDANISTGSEWRFTASGQTQSGRAWSNPGGRDRTPVADRNSKGLEVRGNLGVVPGAGRDDSAAAVGDQESLAHAESLGRRERRTESARLFRRLATSGDWAPSAHAGSYGRQRRQDQQGEGRQEGIGGEAVNNLGHRDSSRLVEWGDYEPGIRRWEARLGRPAPRPTEPTGRAGGERLSPRFTEWMMGLPDGWVTDPAIGITRNEQLKACGNGVVPQQAIAALRDMLAAFQTVKAAA